MGTRMRPPGLRPSGRKLCGCAREVFRRDGHSTKLRPGGGGKHETGGKVCFNTVMCSRAKTLRGFDPKPLGMLPPPAQDYSDPNKDKDIARVYGGPFERLRAFTGWGRISKPQRHAVPKV